MTSNIGHKANEFDHDNDPEEQFQSQMWTYSVWIASIPLLYYGYYKAAFCFVFIGMLYVGQTLLVRKVNSEVSMVDQYKIKYNIYSAEDVIKDVYTWHEKYHNTNQEFLNDCSTSSDSTMYRQIVLAGLSALAKKYNQLQEERNRFAEEKRQNERHQSTKRKTAIVTSNGGENKYHVYNYDDKLTSLALQYQDVVHNICLLPTSMFYTDDQVIGSCLALLALISKNEVVRIRYNYDNLKRTTSRKPLLYNFDSIIQCADKALIRAQETSGDIDDVGKERIAAELQRKVCLFIGAIADDNNYNTSNNILCNQIGKRGGIQTILNAISWYRCHNEVVNWGLWSLFILCYENNQNQIILIQLNGIPLIIESIKNCSDSIDVARHGTAILFDLLRENNGINAISTTYKPLEHEIDKSKIRDVALSAGLHPCIVQCMETSIRSSTSNMDVFVMGREILVGTNYQGTIPEPNMTLIRS